MKKYLLLLIVVLFPALVYTQTDLKQLKPEAYFDFWVGTWDLTWKAPDGAVEKGTNNVKKILDGNVILENFEAKSGSFKGYEGKSFSVFNKKSGTWKQTWVDNNQGYINFVGEFDGNKRIFETEGLGPDGQMVLRRMVFYDIMGDSFTWDWESSTDSGATWKLNWRIHYERKQ